MSIYALEIGSASTTAQRRYVRWEPATAERIRAVFTSGRDILQVRFSPDRAESEGRQSTLVNRGTFR